MHRKGWIIKLILINKFYFVFIMNYIIVISIIICFLLVIITFLRGYFKEKFTIDTCLSRDTNPEWKCDLEVDLDLDECKIRIGDNNEKKCQNINDDKACDFYDNNELECNGLSHCEFVTESDGSTKCKYKQPVSFISDCYEKDQNACENDSNCSYKELSVNGLQVGKCLHKLSCDANEELLSSFDSEGNKIVRCNKCAKGEYLDSNTSKCVSCEYGKYTDTEGATSCQDKSECNLDTHYIDLDIDEDIPTSLSDYEWKINLQSKFYKDEFDVSENRECQPLSACQKNEYVSNHLDYIHPIYQGGAQYKFEIIDAQSNGDAAHCMSKTLPDACSRDSKCEWNSDVLKCHPTEHQNKRFSNYSCSDLQECENDTYISNYHTMKDNMFDGMYIDDISCSNSKICIPGEYEPAGRVTDEFPIITNSSGDAMFTQERPCTTCPVNHYSIEPNVTRCIQQPFAGIGYGTKNYNKDLFESKTNELTIEKCNKKYINEKIVQFYQDESQTRAPCIEQEFTCKKGKIPVFDSKLYISREDIDCNLETNPNVLSQCKLVECAPKKKIDSMSLVGEEKK
jgi:hypothetical protein